MFALKGSLLSSNFVGDLPGDPARICKIGCGENFSAAMSEQGELWVWGRNDYGQLGLGEEVEGLEGLKGVVALTVPLDWIHGPLVCWEEFGGFSMGLVQDL